jgi:prepilin-type N-terminal cleavage/methylation domain-containing protein
MSGNRAPAQAGFTLVEVLVALVATALILGIVVEGALLARQREKAAEMRREAVLLAGHLAAEARAAPFAVAARAGQEGALRWEVREQASAADPRGRFVLAAITVAVRSAEGRDLFGAETRVLKPMPVQ